MRTMRFPNTTLQYERLYRHWTQQDVADAIGTTKINVSRWERGLTRPGAYFRLKLCTLFSKSEQELGIVPGTTCPLPFNLKTTADPLTTFARFPDNAIIMQESFREKLLCALSCCFSEQGISLAQNSKMTSLHIYIVVDTHEQ